MIFNSTAIGFTDDTIIVNQYKTKKLGACLGVLFIVDFRGGN